MFKKLKKLNLINIFKLQGKERKLIFVVIAALFLLANLLISNISLRYDSSSGQAYTLSPATKKILKNLDDIVNINFFASSDLPARLVPLREDVTDILSEYKKSGKGKIQVRITDPKKDEKATSLVNEAGIPELQFSQLEQDKYAITTAYFGISLTYGGKQEVIPQVTDFENLEYNLTSAIYKLVRKDLAKVGIVGQPTTANPAETTLSNLRKILGQQFSLEDLDISSGATTTKIDSSLKTVFVFATNTKEYEDQEIKVLTNYLDNKGKVVFFLDGVWVSDNLTTSAAGHNLFTLVQEFGITVEKNLVLSSSSELVNFGNNEMSLLVPYPFWLKTNRFNPDISYFSNISQLTYPWSSSLKLTKKANVETKELVKTSRSSWEQKDKFELNPQAILPPGEKDLKEFIVSAESEKKNGGMIIVIPSSRFILDQYLSGGADNLEFVLNIVNELASEGALSGIRSRAVTFYPIPELSSSQKDIFKYLNILLLPIILSLYGGWRLLRRK